MSSRVCFLCCQVIDPAIQDFAKETRISTLSQLLLSSSTDARRKVTPQFDQDKNFCCEFCPVCAPVISEMEQIRLQMSLLEEQIERKITKIRQVILQSSENGDDGGNKIRKLRRIILRITESEDNTDDNVVLADIQVKLEQDIGPPGNADDQFFNHYNSFSPTANVEIGNDEGEMDPIKNEVEEDPDSAFCIIPDTQKRGRGRPRKSTKAPRIKRKRGDDSPPQIDEEPVKPAPPRKQTIKEENTRSETRYSPRIRKPILPSSKHTKKILKVSLKRLNLSKVSTTYKAESSSGDEDTKSEPGDNDLYTPKIISSQNKGKNQPSVKICPYKCTTCGKSFPSDSALSSHIALARDHSIPCSVPTCSSSFRSKQSLRAHLKRAHPGVAPFQCTLCKNKFPRENSLATHMVIRHEVGEKKFPCVKCGKSFVLVENLDRHLKLHEVEDIKPLVCHVCDSRFENDERLQRHVETHNNFKCDQCGLPCHTRQGLERHIRLRHTGEKPERCDQCEESFIDQLSLRRHVARVHDCTRDHVCDICGLGFRLVDDLKRHLTRHDDSKKPVCEICGEKFIDRYSFKAHLVKEHGADPFVCEDCGAKFTRLNLLSQHKKIHTGEKPHKCHVCNAAFVWKQLLTAHMRTHTGKRPFPCPHCEQAFKQSKHRSTHIKRIHTPGYVPPIRYPCPHCAKGYEFNHFLQAHIRQVHTEERPFTCDQSGCDKAFAKRTSLYLHLKGHHGIVMEKKCKDRLPRKKKDEFLPGVGDDIE